MIKKFKKNTRLLIGAILGSILLIISVALIKKNNVSSICYEIIDEDLNETHSLTFEYAKGQVDLRDYIAIKEGTMELNTPVLDLSIVGEQEIIYTFMSDDKKKTEELKCTIKIQDTQGPVVNFYSDHVETDEIDNFNPTSNVESVDDPIDGSLIMVEEEPEKLIESSDGKIYENGWFVVTLDKENKEVLVKAVDNHGNVTEKSYSVNVKEAEIKTNDLEGLYYYPSIDLKDGSDWVKVSSDFAWYYDSCSYYSDKYINLTDAYNDVVNYETEQGVNIMDEYVRLFRQEDKNGNVLYYQAGYQEY